MKATGRQIPRLVLVALLSAAVWPAAGHGVCGDGVVDAGEQCDDGGRLPGDCCSPACEIEETRRCETCGDGVDNDGNGRIDAEDPGCATLAELQRAAVVETEPGERAFAEHDTVIRKVVLPGALSGDAVDGRCGDGACVCPEGSPDCQAGGRPCAADADCAAVPYPLGGSRGGLCLGDAAANDASIGCRPQAELVAMVQAIERMPALEIDPIASQSAMEPVLLTFDGGKQVVVVDSVELGPRTSLVLAGERDTVLVIRVRGRFELGDGAALTLAGDLTADHVLWVFPGVEGRIALGEGARFAGTILAPEREAVELGREVTLRGAILTTKTVGSDGVEAPVRFVHEAGG